MLGNHDLHLLRTAAGSRRLGRRDTIQDVLEAPDREELLAWLAERPYARRWPDLILVHAGLHPDWEDPVAILDGIDPLEPDPRTDFATRVRYCDPSGERPRRDQPPPPPPYRPWFELQPRRPETVVFGHWAMLGLVDRPGLRGLDTGCVWGGSLTAWVPDENAYFTARAARVYSSP